MKLTFLGTGTSTGIPTLGCHCSTCFSTDPHDCRTRSSILLEFDHRVVVVDTTPDFRQQGLRERIERLDAVVFTHTHADHVFGLDDVRVFNLRQKHAIPIYADSRSMEDIRRIFTYIFKGDYAAGGIPRLDPHVLDVLILDALRHHPHPTHSTVEQSLEIVNRLRPRRAFFTHIAHELSHEATNSALPPHVRLAYDGLKIELPEDSG